MTNKTCGECKHFSCSDEGQCMDDEWTFCDSDACDKFQSKVVTNGDVIRQMSNEELAIFLGDRVYCFTCPTKGVPCFDKPKDVCYQKWLAYLNAPADCVKQNGNDDTQADLCKADNTESEGEDER